MGKCSYRTGFLVLTLTSFSFIVLPLCSEHISLQSHRQNCNERLIESLLYYYYAKYVCIDPLEDDGCYE